MRSLTLPCCSPIWEMYSSRSVNWVLHERHFHTVGAFILSGFTFSFPIHSSSEVSSFPAKCEAATGGEGSSSFNVGALCVWSRERAKHKPSDNSWGRVLWGYLNAYGHVPWNDPAGNSSEKTAWCIQGIWTHAPSDWLSECRSGCTAAACEWKLCHTWRIYKSACKEL